MDEKNCVCGVENCAAMTEHAFAADNACWGEVGFELPCEFNKVYFEEGPVLKEEVVKVDAPAEEPEKQPEEPVDPETTEGE